jgi:Uma2 family endonuclease
MMVDEFLVWDADDVTGRQWQLVDGEPVLMAPAADIHGTIQAELIRLLGNHMVATGSRCRSSTRQELFHGSAPMRIFAC